MRETIGFNVNNPLVHVTQMSKVPIMELVPEEHANNDAPGSGTTNPGAQPHTTVSSNQPVLSQ